MNKNNITRRNFVKKTAAAGSSLLLAQAVSSAAKPRAKKRYANVGTGSRARMYQNAILENYQEHAELVGLCDPNKGRMKLVQDKAKKITGKSVPGYHSRDFDKMIAETKPDVVIVTSTDGTHHQYVVRAMELGCDVLTEKPMTIDEKKCQQIIDTQKRTGKQCKVAFNYRYSPPRTHVKHLLQSGAIGEVRSVDFQWLLNTHHGADYFRRWHGDKGVSGGLMVHKSTHHFDLMNWWLSSIPVSVMAKGKREFYTPEMAKRMGLKSHHERCHTCPEKGQCGFELDMSAKADLKRLYLDNEKHDGYFRDRCIFRPEINIEDTMHVMVTYDDNVELSYSLNAFNSWEGYIINFNGTKGRIEHQIQEQLYMNGDGGEQGSIAEGGVTTRLIPLRGEAQELTPWTGEGSHGGGDKVMLDEIFLPVSPIDKYARTADHRSGAYSILTGIAANKSFVSNRAVSVADLVKGIGYPEYSPKPSPMDSLPMLKKL